MENDDKAILPETLAAIRDVLGPELDGITVERAVIGLFFTGVKLDNGIAGACATPIKTIPEAVCCPSSAMAMPFPGNKVVVVGAFVPFLRELNRRHQPYLVLEQDPATLKADELPFFRPAEQAAAVVPEADVLLITGTTLINDTLEELLALASPTARVTMVGPTVSLLPDGLLRRGADILGTVRITDPDAFLDILAEGGSGYHFLGRTAQKVVLVRRPAARAAAA